MFGRFCIKNYVTIFFEYSASCLQNHFPAIWNELYSLIIIQYTWGALERLNASGISWETNFYFKLLTPTSDDPLTLSVCCLQRSGRLKERCSEQQWTKQEAFGHRRRHHGSIRLDRWNEQAWWLKLTVGCCRAALNDEISCSEERSVPPFFKNICFSCFSSTLQ